MDVTWDRGPGEEILIGVPIQENIPRLFSGGIRESPRLLRDAFEKRGRVSRKGEKGE